MRKVAAKLLAGQPIQARGLDRATARCRAAGRRAAAHPPPPSLLPWPPSHRCSAAAAAAACEQQPRLLLTRCTFSMHPGQVFTLGGSVTRGLGATRPEHNYPNRFFAALNATWPHARHTFSNKGIGESGRACFGARRAPACMHACLAGGAKRAAAHACCEFACPRLRPHVQRSTAMFHAAPHCSTLQAAPAAASSPPVRSRWCPQRRTSWCVAGWQGRAARVGRLAVCWLPRVQPTSHPLTHPIDRSIPHSSD